MNKHTARESCAACGSKSGLPLAALGEVSVIEGGGDRLPLDLSFCGKCGLVQTDLIINPDMIFKECRDFNQNSWTFHLDGFADDIDQRYGGLSDEDTTYSLGLEAITRKKVLEFGCSDGVLLDELAKKGANVMGIDPCGKAIEAVREKGLLAVREYFGSKNFLKPETENEYDMIVASSVLDRVADLNDVITTIKHLLRPNGHFIFEVHYLGALTKNREIVSHELAYYFSITSLQRLFEERAMTVIDFQDIYSRPNLIRVHVENNNVDAEKEVWDRIDKESKTIASLEYLKEKLK